jgi:hypothetical protein
MRRVEKNLNLNLNSNLNIILPTNLAASFITLYEISSEMFEFLNVMCDKMWKTHSIFYYNLCV